MTRRKSLIPRGSWNFRSPRNSGIGGGPGNADANGSSNQNLATKSASTLIFNRNNSYNNFGNNTNNQNDSGGPGQDDPKIFFFDRLFSESATEDEVFDAVNEEIRAATEGHYVSLIAYGATGSGKTHTISNIATKMGGELQDFVHHVVATGDKVEMHMQLLEIYNDQLRDLLAPTKPGPGSGPQSQSCNDLKIVHDINNNVTVTPSVLLRLSPESCVSGLHDALQVAKRNRVTHVTNVHERSSRSHMIMTLYIKRLDASNNIIQAGKLNLVDLAGSERVKKSEATGDRLKEAQSINRSLSALADVIWAFERKVAHIPYRNSKLTHLLQDSLGGSTTRTVMFVTCDSKLSSTQETLHTLQFGSRLNSVSMNSNTLADRKALGNCVEQNRLQACLDQEQQRVATEAERNQVLEKNLQEQEIAIKQFKEENANLQKKVAELSRQRALVAQQGPGAGIQNQNQIGSNNFGPFSSSSPQQQDQTQNAEWNSIQTLRRIEFLEMERERQAQELEKLRNENVKLKSQKDLKDLRSPNGTSTNYNSNTTAGTHRFQPSPRGVSTTTMSSRQQTRTGVTGGGPRASSATGHYNGVETQFTNTSPRTKRSPQRNTISSSNTQSQIVKRSPRVGGSTQTQSQTGASYMQPTQSRERHVGNIQMKKTNSKTSPGSALAGAAAGLPPDGRQNTQQLQTQQQIFTSIQGSNSNNISNLIQNSTDTVQTGTQQQIQQSQAQNGNPARRSPLQQPFPGPSITSPNHNAPNVYTAPQIGLSPLSNRGPALVGNLHQINSNSLNNNSNSNSNSSSGILQLNGNSTGIMSGATVGPTVSTHTSQQQQQSYQSVTTQSVPQVQSSSSSIISARGPQSNFMPYSAGAGNLTGLVSSATTLQGLQPNMSMNQNSIQSNSKLLVQSNSNNLASFNQISAAAGAGPTVFQSAPLGLTTNLGSSTTGIRNQMSSNTSIQSQNNQYQQNNNMTQSQQQTVAKPIQGNTTVQNLTTNANSSSESTSIAKTANLKLQQQANQNLTQISTKKKPQYFVQEIGAHEARQFCKQYHHLADMATEDAEVIILSKELLHHSNSQVSVSSTGSDIRHRLQRALVEGREVGPGASKSDENSNQKISARVRSNSERNSNRQGGGISMKVGTGKNQRSTRRR